MFEPKRILVPTDFSDHSNKAMLTAIRIAQKYQSKILLLHVLDAEIHEYAVDFCIPAIQLEQMIADNHERTLRKMVQQMENLNDEPPIKVEYDVRKGVPYDVILHEQREKEADLIVMAPRGKSKLERYLLGSVTVKVVENATVPVLVVH